MPSAPSLPLFAIVIGLLAATPGLGDDWLAYRGDARRTGYRQDGLTFPLQPCWSYHATPPRRAWPRSSRMQFDQVFQPVVARQQLYFGSSADGTVRAIDIRTGRIQWTYFTEGPVRFAPAVWRDRLFVCSDDGYLHAIAQRDGRLLWKRRGGPSDALVLGNGTMISKWPARGGPVVVDDTVYFAAGIWPSDGIYVYALEAATGAAVWINDAAGGLDLPQPHGGAQARSGISAQGYLVATSSQLLVPTGRAVPACLDRGDGSFQYFHLQRYGQHGGDQIVALDETFLHQGLLFQTRTGDKVADAPGGPYAATPEMLVRYAQGGVEALRLAPRETVDRKGNPVTELALQSLWRVESVDAKAALIVAGNEIIAGGEGLVTVIDTQTRQGVATFEVEGTAHGLAVADGRLFVSTDHGWIYCFGVPAEDGESGQRDTVAETRDDDTWSRYAEALIGRSGVTDGFCLDLGCGDGSLACELARRTQLHIVAVDDDPAQVDLARQRLMGAGLYGTRVTVFQRPLDSTGLPRYFADLIISARSGQGQRPEVPKSELTRMQRPYGGVVCWGPPDDLSLDRRGPLEGAGQWTHQYADAANTLNSDDQRVRGPLGMLWFGDIDFEVPQRHGRAPAPLFEDGRLFHQGLDGIIAVDAYNGRQLWRYDIPGILRAYDGDELLGTAGTGGNYCVHGGSVYVRDGQRCLRLNARTGALISEFTIPAGSDGKRGTWGYISCVDGILYGTEADDEHIVTYRYINRGGDMTQLLTESKRLFALDATTGELLWDYQATDSIRHNAIAIARGKVFLIDRPLALFDREKEPESGEHPAGRLLALDGRTGNVVWDADGPVQGTMLAVSEALNAVLVSYQPTRFRLDSEIGGHMAVFEADSGEPLWETQAKYESRPVLNGSTIYAQGGAWDLLTGESKPFNFSRSYGCGILASCQNTLLFRSATLGYFDLHDNDQTMNYGGMRPGCWVNIIPAGGIVLVPDAAAGCECSYLNKSWFALEPLTPAEPPTPAEPTTPTEPQTSAEPPPAAEPLTCFAFASVEQAAQVLASRDLFVTQMTRFDRQSRMGTSQPVGEDSFLQFARDQVLAWQPAEIDRLRTVLESVQRRLASVPVPLRLPVLLIKTTGNEEGNAAYCRGGAIVLPQRMLARPSASLERLLVHELFHVISCQNPKLRRALYEMIGFHPCGPIQLPPLLADLKITNPDGPAVDHLIRVRWGDETLAVTPLIYARREYDQATGGSFFQYLQFRLMAIQQQGERWVARLDESGQPVLLDPQSVSGYWERIGRNTSYIIHPDEILADNFVHLVFQTPDLKTPELVAQLRHVLAEHVD